MRGSENTVEARKKIGNYWYVGKDVIGKGYSSVVYKAQSESDGSTLALKLIDMKNIKGEVHKVLLSNELEILRLLNNLQNIIQLHEIIPLKSHTCIVTEFCDGGDLAKVIKARKLIPEQEAQEILKQIINGYRGMHRFGIVHRDLKPANIFFNEGKVKIADFGFAIKNSDLKKASSYNVGSPVYMPIQALNDNLYSSKSDIWAIGVIFFEMLTGHTPWKAKTEADLKRQIKAVSIKTLIPAHLSRSSSDFLLKTLQLNSNLRMTSEQMIQFFDTDRDSSTMDQSLASTHHRGNNLFRTRAPSQDRPDRHDKNCDNSGEIPKNTVTAPKTFRKMSKLADYNGLEKLNQGQRKAFQNTGFQKLGDHKLGSLARTTAGLGEEWIPDHKKISSHLLSQIHFCRFFYKLIERMEKLGMGSERLKILMSSIISGKLNQVQDLTMINPKYGVLFRRTKECERIQEVVQQYLTKYQRILSWEADYPQALKEIEEELTSEILNLYDRTKQYQTLEGHDEEVILLDYFITMKQLLLINAKKDVEYFHRRSKIEAIVEGRPAKNITQDHFEAIVHKLRVFKLIS